MSSAPLAVHSRPSTAEGTQYSCGDPVQPRGPRTTEGTQDSHGDRVQLRGPSAVAGLSTVTRTGRCCQRLLGSQLFWISCVMTPFPGLRSPRRDHSSEPTPGSFEMPPPS